MLAWKNTGASAFGGLALQAPLPTRKLRLCLGNDTRQELSGDGVRGGPGRKQF